MGNRRSYSKDRRPINQDFPDRQKNYSPLKILICLAGYVLYISTRATSFKFETCYWGKEMPFIGRVASPAPTLDHQVNSFDATEELILLGQDHAFVKKDDQVIGIVCLDNLLDEYKSGDISATSVAEFMEPLFFVKEYELRLKAVELMLINDIEHIAVTNGAGDFVGIASLKKLKNE